MLLLRYRLPLLPLSLACPTSGEFLAPRFGSTTARIPPPCFNALGPPSDNAGVVPGHFLPGVRLSKLYPSGESGLFGLHTGPILSGSTSDRCPGFVGLAPNTACSTSFQRTLQGGEHIDNINNYRLGIPAGSLLSLGGITGHYYGAWIFP